MTVTSKNTKDEILAAYKESQRQLLESDEIIANLQQQLAGQTVMVCYPVWELIWKLIRRINIVSVIKFALWIAVIVVILTIAWQRYIGTEPNPKPDPKPDVIQLDRTEYAMYQSALDFVKPLATLEEKQQALYLLLGEIPMKSRIINDFPNEKIEVLP